ncbi:MAG: NAD(P)/FAD-dependent oxidoreductase [Polyangiales bacterium]
MLDVIIIGGSYAGLSAALQLGRARRSVLVLDAGQRRNRFASHAHGFLGRDGVPPGDIVAQGRAELLRYATVSVREATVREVRPVEGGFAVCAVTESFRAKRIILATGVGDKLPEVPGLADAWGKTAFHCPYCHGYELNRGQLGVLATSPMSLHHAQLVPEWGPTTFFTNGVFTPSEAERADLSARGVRVEPARVHGVQSDEKTITVQLEEGRTQRLEGLFVLPRTQLVTPFAEQLGLAVAESPMGPYYQTDALKQTTVPGVFACGDAGLAMGSVAFAVADGAMAGVSAHRSLVFPA